MSEQFSMFNYLLGLLNAHINALLTLLMVYLIGLCYAVLEFYTDYSEKQKFMSKNKLFRSKMEEWRKSSSMLKNDFEFAVEENEGGQQNDYTLTAVLTGADGTIGCERLQLVEAFNKQKLSDWTNLKKILDYLLSLEFYVFVIGMSAPHLDSDQLHFIKCDLSDRNQVFEAVECVLLCASHIDLLVLNAAMMLCPNAGWLPFRFDCFGQTIIEPHLAVNVLANAQLFASFAHRLEDSRIRSPRAVFVSSCTAHAGDLSLLLQDEEKFWCHRINGYKAYADSKLLLSVYVKYLNRILKYRQSKIAVVSVHPGVVPGKLYRNVFAPFRLVVNVFLRPFLRSPLLAATRVLDVAFADDLLEGSYYENGLVTALKRMDDAEFVWSIGTSVREMIVDSNDNSFNTKNRIST